MNRRLYRCRRESRARGCRRRASPSTSTLDPTLVRVLWFISIFFGGFGLLLYIAMAIIVPIEPLARSTARTPSTTHRGEPDGCRPRRSSPVRRGHRHATHGDGRGTMFVGLVLILFGGLALIDTLLPGWADAGRYPRPRVHRRRRRPPRRQRRSTRAHGLVIGGAVLVTGLLLVLAALWPRRRIPGGARSRLVGDRPYPRRSSSPRSIRPRGTPTARSRRAVRRRSSPSRILAAIASVGFRHCSRRRRGGVLRRRDRGRPPRRPDRAAPGVRGRAVAPGLRTRIGR